MSKHISLASYELEAAARAEGYAHVCGADEAGAGPLMGPVYAAAVILPEGCVIEGLDDSKKLSARRCLTSSAKGRSLTASRPWTRGRSTRSTF